MSTCCDTAIDTPAGPPATFTIALAGNPNSGKTTIFNGLTGMRQKVANYPGVTVEKKTGKCKLPNGRWIDVIDLPGTYSLISRSPDETVAMEVLRGLRADTSPPDAVMVVVDASNLQRNLYLVSQLIELGRPLVIALNMMDVAERRGLRVSAERLEKALGVPVVGVVGHRKEGIEQLKAAILRAKSAPMPDWPLPEAMKEELLLVGGGLAIMDSQEDSPIPKPAAPASDNGDKSKKLDHARLAFSVQAKPPHAFIVREDDQAGHLTRYQAMAERLLIGDRAADLGEISQRQPVASLLNSAASRLETLGIDPMQADIEAHYRWIDDVASLASTPLDLPATDGSAVLQYETAKPRNLSDKIDSVLIHKIWGLAIFAVIMGLLFVTIFWLAQPIMDGITGGIDWLGGATTAHMVEGPLKSLVANGIFKGVGAVVVFVPQIALLFMFLAILEDSGYLARAAFLMDRLLAKVGLHGKSFIPLLSSFACAIPGIMATRTIESRKDRLATILVAPFMSCSARLPVYTLLIGTFFVTWGAFAQAGIMLSCYILGIVAAAVTAWFFKRSLLKGPTPAFILEMPSYKVPQWSQVLRQVWVNTKEFLTKAGTTIFCLSVVLWAMTYYPRLPQTRVDAIKTQETAFLASPGAVVEGDGSAANVIAAAQREYSIAGRLGHFMEPALKPLGYDWKMGVGLVGAFAAREVFVSTMAITYGAGDGEETESLREAMKHDKYTSGSRAGQAVWTPLVAISLLVWFVLAMQCMSTLAVVRRETGGWRWPIFMLIYMNVLAYACAFGVYQIGKLIA